MTSYPKWHKTGCHLKWGDMTLSSVIWLYMILQETNKNDPKECDLNDMIWNLKWHEVRQSMTLHLTWNDTRHNVIQNEVTWCNDMLHDLTWHEIWENGMMGYNFSHMRLDQT